MALRRVAATRLVTLAVAALLLAAAPSSRAESQDLRATNAADGSEALAVRLLYGEGLLSSTPRLSTRQAYREIERLRPLSDPVALAALGIVLFGALSWCSPARLRGRRSSASPARPFAGPRAPPVQLA
jgi:hypothetical protein